MTRRPTIADVAAAAGVSMATVSKAVNGRYGVNGATARRVLDVVEQLGYESSIVARGMRGQRTGVIGVLVAEFEPFSAEVLKGIGTALPHRYDLLAYSGARDHGRDGWERRSLSRLGGSLLDGAILVTPTVVDVAATIPVVAVDPHTGPADLPTVESDSHGGAVLATEHLIGLGHRRIAFVAGRPDLRSSILREAGYRQALKTARIRFDPGLVRSGGYDPERSRESAVALLRQHDRPTAVFAANDVSAMAIVEVAAHCGLGVPRDLSVVGFDDIPESASATPPLTTVHQPMQRLGSAAADMLVALLGQGGAAPAHLRLPTRLVRRGTTAPPPSPDPTSGT